MIKRTDHDLTDSVSKFSLGLVRAFKAQGLGWRLSVERMD